MDARSALQAFVGAWAGSKRLRLSPDTPDRVSEATARVTLVAGGGFASLAYAWSDEGAPQDGLLLVRLDERPGPLDMVWVDSWHTGGGFMTFQRDDDPQGGLSASGTYAAPPGPDWGWRVVVDGDADGELRLTMFNVPPGESEVLAVDARFQRVSGG